MVHAARNFEEPQKRKKSAPKPEGRMEPRMTSITPEMIAESGHKRVKLPGVEMIDFDEAKGAEAEAKRQEAAQAGAERVMKIAEESEKRAPAETVKEVQALRKEQADLQAWFDGEMGKAEEKGGALGKRIRELAMTDKKAARLREVSERLSKLMEYAGGEEGYAEMADKVDFDEMIATQREAAAEREQRQEEQARHAISEAGIMVTESDVGSRAAQLKRAGRLPKDFDVAAYEKLWMEAEALQGEKERLEGSFASRLRNRGRLKEVSDKLEAVELKLEPMREQVMKQNVAEAVGKEAERQKGQELMETWRRIRETGDAAEKLKAEGYAPKSPQGQVAWELFQDAKLPAGFDVVAYDRMEAEVDRLQAEEAELERGGFWNRLKNAGRLSDIRRKIRGKSESLRHMRDDVIKASAERRSEEKE